MALSGRSRSGESKWGWRLRQVLFWLWLVGVTSLVLVYSVPEGYDLAVGDVAAQNVVAPRELSYVSEILSRQAQEDAARRVTPRYTSPNPMVAREQYNRARAVLSFLRAVRADALGADVQRSHYVWAVPELSDLPEDTVLTTLRLPDASWSRVQLEFLDLLDQVMRQDEIRESELVLIRQRIPTLIPLDLAQDEAEVLEGLVSRFVRPNVYYDEAATIAATEAARQAVVPAVRQFRSGEVVVREGTVVSALDLEALTQFGLTTASDEGPGVGVAVLLAAVCVAAGGLFVHHLRPEALDGGKAEALIVLVLTVFVGLAWMLLRSGELVPYLYPGAAVGLLVATTAGPVPAIGSVFLLSVISGWIGAHSLASALMVALGGLMAVLALPRYEQTGPLFRSGLISGVVQALVVFVFSVDELTVTPFLLLVKLGISVLGGVIAGGLAVGGLFVLTPMFDLTTTFRLTELARPNHPLLQRLLREAPATFNHVMMVTSLAEQAAERIGANALLTRVGAYYHDVGKLARPYFFVENQQGMSNPHDRLDPYTSLDVLAGHVRDGLKLAEQHHLPARVRAFIPEHHGTTRVSFLYQKAVEAAGGEADLVDEAQFRYPGPAPQSIETLLVMLADGAEAATRARRPSTEEEFEAVVDFIFDQRMRDGQLNEAPITMAQLHTVRQTYVSLLRGAIHPRIQYPEPKKPVTPAQLASDGISPVDEETEPRLVQDEDVAEAGDIAMDAVAGDGGGAGSVARAAGHLKSEVLDVDYTGPEAAFSAVADPLGLSFIADTERLDHEQRTSCGGAG
jgi:hypothetical protein